MNSFTFFPFISFIWRQMSLFPSIFPLSLCMDYRLRRTFFPSGWWFFSTL